MTLEVDAKMAPKTRPPASPLFDSRERLLKPGDFWSDLDHRRVYLASHS